MHVFAFSLCHKSLDIAYFHLSPCPDVLDVRLREHSTLTYSSLLSSYLFHSSAALAGRSLGLRVCGRSSAKTNYHIIVIILISRFLVLSNQPAFESQASIPFLCSFDI